MLLCVFRILSCSELRTWPTGLPKGMNFVQGSTWEAESLNHFAIHLKQTNYCKLTLPELKRYSFIQNCSKFCEVFLSIVGSSVRFSSLHFSSFQFSRSVVSNSATPWTAAHQASLSITISRSSLRLTSIESVMPSSHLILCRSLLLLPPIPPSIRVFSNESTLRMR